MSRLCSLGSKIRFFCNPTSRCINSTYKNVLAVIIAALYYLILRLIVTSLDMVFFTEDQKISFIYIHGKFGDAKSLILTVTIFVP